MNSISLKVGERVIDFNFGLAFLGELLNKLGTSMSELSTELTENPFRTIPTAMYTAAEAAASRKGQKLDFDQAQFTDWLEESGGLATDTVDDFLNAFMDSLLKNVPAEKADPNSPKKK